MNSNSYLGMSLRLEVIAAEEEGRQRYGAGPGAVRFISGTYEPHVELERSLAAFHNREGAMIFSSAYATVLGHHCAPHTTRRHDRDQR
jgi:glycine C-acetyltransferase